MHRSLLLFQLTLVFSFFVTVTNAQTWTGGGADNYWDNPANWLGGIPGPNDIAFIAQGFSVIIPMGLDVDIKSLHLGNTSSLQVQAEAVLTINNASSHGIYNIGNLLNFGTIEINNSGGHAIRLFLDTANGMQYGIFQNFGKLFINGTTGGDGVYGEQDEFWYGENQSFFYNFSDAYIEMENIDGSAVNMNHLENYGRIKLIGSPTDYGILLDDPDGGIHNIECGKILMQNEIHITDGDFINDGFINQGFNGSHTIQSPGTFTNNGFLEDHYGSFLGIAFTNSGRWLNPLDPPEAPYEGSPIKTIISGNSTDFSFYNVYSEHALLTQAGTYDESTNVWETHLVDATDTTFYMEVTHVPSSCKDTVKFVLKKPFLSMNYWIGGTSFWDQASNWKHNYIPQAGDTAAVYKSMSTAIVVNYHGQLQKLIVTGNVSVGVDASLTFSGSLQNDYGIDMDKGTFTNSGSIILSGSQAGIHIRPGVFTNNGSITVTGIDRGVVVDGQNLGQSTLINHGTIISSGCNEGIWGENLVNEASGQIMIYDPIEVGFYATSTNYNHGNIIIRGDDTAIGIRGAIDNYGDIAINRMDVGMQPDGNNYGTIAIDSMNTAGIDHQDAWNNQSAGTTTITNSPAGILLSDGLLDNFGSIDIAMISGDGIYGISALDNEEGGSITIDDISGNAMHLSRDFSDFGSFDNDGKVYITNCGGNGFNVEGGSLDNLSSGEFHIDHIPAGNGIFLDVGDFSLDPSFSNDGLIDFGENIADEDIKMVSSGPIYNYNCNGILNLKNGLNLNGDLYNYGFINQNYDGSNMSSDTIVNYGVINDVKGSFNGTNLINEGLYFEYIPGTHQINSVINTNFGIPFTNSNHMVTVNWYLDQNLTEVGAQFDLNAEELALSPAAIGKDTMYFRVGNDNCSSGPMIDTFLILFENPIELDCGNIVWNGGASVWSNPMNWDKNRLPASCDTAMIQNVMDSVIITTADPIQLTSLKNNGTLRIGLQSELIINDSSGIGIISFGNIEVNGIFSILNAGSHGFICSTGHLVNKGTMNVVNSGGDGVRLANSIYDLRANGTLNIQNSSFRNMVLSNQSTFIATGVLQSQ